jgi:hypothetical protein
MLLQASGRSSKFLQFLQSLKIKKGAATVKQAQAVSADRIGGTNKKGEVDKVDTYKKSFQVPGVSGVHKKEGAGLTL